MEKTKGQQAKDKLEEIKILLRTEQITYEQAKEMAQEPIKTLNEEMEKIAKQFGRKHSKISFGRFIR